MSSVDFRRKLAAPALARTRVPSCAISPIRQAEPNLKKLLDAHPDWKARSAGGVRLQLSAKPEERDPRVVEESLLEATRQFAPKAVFIFTSTNKVYGDTPNLLPLRELETRWEIEPGHRYEIGIDETMSIDSSKHSLFGASKVAADVLVQEYGRYFGMKTASFRGGCLTGPSHSGAQLHGFLAYLMQCTISGNPYTVFGYKGKQVRDNIHSFDLVNAFFHFYKNPRSGEVYNMGGSRHSNCSMKEAIAMCEEIADKKLKHSYTDDNRSGDHIWYISDVRKFQSHYPAWKYKYDMRGILQEIFEAQAARIQA